MQQAAEDHCKNGRSDYLQTWIRSFNDVSKAKQASLQLANQGATVLIPTCDTAGQGVIEAAKQKNDKLIMSYVDQSAAAPRNVITSWRFAFDKQFDRIGSLFKADRLEPKIYEQTFANGGIDVVLPVRNVDPKVAAGVEKVVADLKAGRITVQKRELEPRPWARPPPDPARTIPRAPARTGAWGGGFERHFGPVRAYDGVDVSFRFGEIHGLLGENGAGKSTLIKILGGIYRPYAGEIRLDGEPVRFASADQARRRGIAIVHQHSALVGRLTVLENVALQFGGVGRVDRSLPAAIRATAEGLGFALDPQARVDELSPGHRQRAEIHARTDGQRSHRRP